MIKELASRFKDEFYQLERALFGKSDSKESHVVQITSSHSGEGVTSTTLALATFLARQHPSEEVMVVEANLREPCFEQLLAFKAEGSLFDVLRNSGSLRHAIHKLPDYGFSVIPAGRPHVTDTFISYDLDLERVDDVLAVLKKKYRYVLVDSPPVVPFVDATTICRMADGVVLLVESEQTRSEVVDHTIQKLRSAGAEILGIILNKREFHIPKRIYRFL
ncbi:MAG: CpsD/CapB family tyrosine-protein kinase [Desulfomonile tiedjei]|nr:CpsD/CapB family tyrosine-protein kinase [Desulfomonile tiedjei]